MKRNAEVLDCREKESKHARICKVSNFKTQPLSAFDSKFPYYRQPQEIGFFSQDKNRLFSPDNSQLKRFFPAVTYHNVSFDLTNGYHSFIKRDEEVKEYLDDLLKWVVLNPKPFQCHPKQTETSKEESTASSTSEENHLKG